MRLVPHWNIGFTSASCCDIITQAPSVTMFSHGGDDDDGGGGRGDGGGGDGEGGGGEGDGGEGGGGEGEGGGGGGGLGRSRRPSRPAPPMRKRLGVPAATALAERAM